MGAVGVCTVDPPDRPAGLDLRGRITHLDLILGELEKFVEIRPTNPRRLLVQINSFDERVDVEETFGSPHCDKIKEIRVYGRCDV